MRFANWSLALPGVNEHDYPLIEAQRTMSTRLTENDVTPEPLYRERRLFIVSAAAALGASWAGRNAIAAPSPVVDKPNTLEEISSYNNYYEFSTNKEAVRVLAQALSTSPWNLTVEGEVAKPFTIGVEDLLKRFFIEERIYRLRCVEGWSMVIPWNGFPLHKLIDLAQPTGQAKYIEFVSLLRPKEMIGQRQSSLDWPYREALRLDEARHPLAFMATGLYGQTLPKQNGAPLRLVVPWKYGFKQPKAITHIRFLRDIPKTSWQQIAPTEYGFYGNVNPDVAHPRWSQRRENRIGELRKRPTLPFNGYAQDVAHLYAGLDPKLLF